MEALKFEGGTGRVRVYPAQTSSAASNTPTIANSFFVGKQPLEKAVLAHVLVL